MINSKKVKGRMTELGITQEVLAKKLGLSQATICQKINNKRAMSLEEADAISEILYIKNEEFPLYFFAAKVAQCNKNV